MNELNDDLSQPTPESLTSELSTSITPEPPIPAKPSTLKFIFFGADGLRAGWSIAIFIVLVAIIMWGVSKANHLLHILPHTPGKSDDLPAGYAYASEGILFAVVCLVSWIMSKIERRPVSVYGLGGERKLPHFFAGLAWGVTCLSLLVFTLIKTGLLVIDTRLLFGSDIFRYGALWFGGFLLVGLLEEYLTRGYLQYTLARGMTGLYKSVFNLRHSATLGFWTAAVTFSILFGLGHGSNPGESPIGLIAAGIAALVFCLSLWRTGSLWWAIGFHATWDWAQSFLYGVADSGLMIKFHLFATHPVGKPLLSGGTTGPEGSIYILLILTLVALIIIFTLPRAGQNNASEPPAQLEALGVN